MSGKRASQYRISRPTWDVFVVHCPGERLGLCNGHTFKTYREARQWVRQEEEGK